MSDTLSVFLNLTPHPASPGTTYYPLVVTKTGTGAGHVGGDPQLGIDCGSECSSIRPSHTFGVLVATPDAGSVFLGWAGDCLTIEDDRCTIHLTSSKSVTANFGLEEPDPTPEPSPTPTPEPNLVERGPCEGAVVGSTTELSGGGLMIVGTSGPDELTGGSGKDVICGRGGADVLLGGAGADRLSGGGGGDELRGGSGDDACYGGHGHDRYFACEHPPRNREGGN